MADLATTVPDTRLVYVADREGGLRALIDAATCRGTPADWLIRSKHNRKTTTEEKPWDRLAQSEPLGEVEFTRPAALDRSTRRVRQTLYRKAVTLPAHHGQPAVTVTWGRDYPRLPGDVVFDPEEWQAAWIVAYRAQPPQTPPPLGAMVRLIAGFGCFPGRKHDGHPGPKAIWEGMQNSECVRHCV